MKERLEVVERLTNLFRFERLVYLGITLISLVMLLGSALSLIYQGNAGTAELTLMFGSSGLITYSTGRLLHMWDKALERVVPSKELDKK